MEHYRPTPEEIENAKQGSNELFSREVLPHHQPNNIRKVENLAGLTGIWRGIYYLSGVAQLPKEKNGEI